MKTVLSFAVLSTVLASSAASLAAPPAGLTVGPPARVTMGPPASVTMGPPASVTMGPPASVTMGPPASVTMGPPASVTMGPPAGATMGRPPVVPVGPPTGVLPNGVLPNVASELGRLNAAHAATAALTHAAPTSAVGAIATYNTQMTAALALNDPAAKDAAIISARQQLSASTDKQLTASSVTRIDGMLGITGASPDLGTSP